MGSSVSTGNGHVMTLDSPLVSPGVVAPTPVPPVPPAVVPNIFGPGIDGNVTLNGNISLNRDMYYDTLTINAGANLYTKSQRIFAKTAIINNGTIKIQSGTLDGANAVLTSGGNGGSVTTGPTASLPLSQSGGSGANGAGSGAGAAGQSPLFSSNVVLFHPGSRAATGSLGSWNSGSGGNGSAGASGGTYGTSWSLYSVEPHLMPVPIWWVQQLNSGTTIVFSAPGGSGGGAGGGDGATGAGGGGGGGGAGGPIICLYAPMIINNGTIDIRGGNGGNGNTPVVGTGGGGGGGSGGSGGILHVITLIAVSGTGTILKSGGNGGTGGPGRGTGLVGVNGANGPIGIIAVHNIAAGTLTLL